MVSNSQFLMMQIFFRKKLLEFGVFASVDCFFQVLIIGILDIILNQMQISCALLHIENTLIGVYFDN